MRLSAPVRALAPASAGWLSCVVCGVLVQAACQADPDPREAFTGTYAFASGSIQTDCAPIPEDHQTIDDTIEVTLMGETLMVAIDGISAPCADESQLEASPRQVGCDVTRNGATYALTLRIDLSYDHASFLRVVKTFDDPACSVTYSGVLTPA